VSHADLENRAVAAELDHRWEEAGELFLQLAHERKDSKVFDAAADYFMRSAIAFERAEEWRKIGHLWLQCAGALQRRPESAVSNVYDFLEASKHFFPTLDFYAWSNFSHHERLGRALRNAAYHLEKVGSNQSAYVQYKAAGEAFRAGNLCDEASRSYYLALMSFIERHGELDDDTLECFEAVNKALTKDDETKYIRRIRTYYRRLASALSDRGNDRDASLLFCEEADIARRLSRRQRNIGKWVAYTFWKWTSHYGTNATVWSSWAFLLFFIGFPILFSLPGVCTWHVAERAPTAVDFVYLSLATVTTASDPNFDFMHTGKCIAIVEGLLGFFMLGSLLSILSKRFAR
jgi:hypothetical protein